jgi:hypothetical protein
MAKKIYNILFFIGALTLLISSVLVMENVTWGKYAFAGGTALYIVSRMRSVYSGNDFRLKRLNRMYLMSAFFMLAASYMQFENMRSWVAVLLMSALTELYTAMRLSWYEKEIAKEKAEAAQKPKEGQ